MSLMPNEVDVNAALRAGWVELLARGEWDHCTTLTLSNAVPTRRALDEELRCWKARLANLAGNPVWTAAAFEQTNGRLHVHAFVGGTDLVSSEAVAGAWRGGLAKADPFDGSYTAFEYVTKALGDGSAELDIDSDFERAAKKLKRLRAKQERGQAPIPDTRRAAEATAARGKALNGRLLRRRGS